MLAAHGVDIALSHAFGPRPHHALIGLMAVRAHSEAHVHRSAVKQIGLDKYIKGVSTLFDPTSQVDLISVDQVDDSTFKTRWRLAAKVNFPFKLTLKPYMGNTIYKLNSDHLIQSQTARLSPVSCDSKCWQQVGLRPCKCGVLERACCPLLTLQYLPVTH